MLVIARRVGEALYIGPDIVLVIREVQGKQVRIGIEAPSSVAVARAELLPRESRDAAADPEKAPTKEGVDAP